MTEGYSEQEANRSVSEDMKDSDYIEENDEESDYIDDKSFFKWYDNKFCAYSNTPPQLTLTLTLTLLMSSKPVIQLKKGQ